MYWRLRRSVSAIALVAMLPLTLGAAPPASPSEDLRQSYQLLTTTYYSKIDAQRLLDGARQSLVALAAKHGGRVRVPALHDTGTMDGNINELIANVQRMQSALHLSKTDITYAEIDGMANALGDRYTTFFTPDAFRQFNSELDPEKISGIGVMVRVDDASKYIQAQYVVPGTPAEKAGLKTGDLFASVDGKSLKGLKADQASALLRGKPGTVVHLQALRDGKALAPLTIVRSEVQPPTVIYRMLPQHVGYIYVLAFGRQTPDEFALALNRLQKRDVRAYVIDLRDDGGGYVNSALDISSKFIDRNPLLTIEERGSHTTTVDAGSDALPRKPMAILVNRYTASASEITAAALRDNGVAVLVGEKTFGKGVMQSLTPLPDGAAIKITTAHYLTPNNQDINLKGIEPDYVVMENKDARLGELRHDAQLRAAIGILTRKIADAKN